MAKPALYYERLPLDLEMDEIEEYLYYLIERDTDALTYYTGMRIGELTNLLVQSVDLDRAVIHIRQSKNRKDRYLPISSHSIRGGVALWQIQ